MTKMYPWANGHGIEKVAEPDVYCKSTLDPELVPQLEDTTEECRTFLNGMLEEDPTKRWSIAQACNSPWILMYDM